MKIVFTAAALADLNDLLTYTEANYPALVNPIERRIRTVIERISLWPELARKLEQKPDVRARAPLSIQNILPDRNGQGGNLPYPSHITGCARFVR